MPVKRLDPGSAIVMTGHQPELYHPGVWVKDFLLQRLSEETGASAIDVVVDSDGFDTVSVSRAVPRTGGPTLPSVPRGRHAFELLRVHASARAARDRGLLSAGRRDARDAAGALGSAALLGVLRLSALRCR